MSTFAKIDNYQSLALANDLFLSFHMGDQRVTARHGRRDIALDDLVFISTDPAELGVAWDIYCHHNAEVHMCQLVTVTEVRYKRVFHVTNEEAQSNGFRNKLHLYEGMKKFYPDLSLNDEMTFVYFDIR